MKICKNTKISILIVFLLFSLFLPAGQISAEEPAVTEPQNNCNLKTNQSCQKDTDGDGVNDIEITNITTAGGAPKLITRSLKIKSTGGSQFIESPGIANYIASIYKYAVGLITILTTIMIIISGVMWITSAGNPEKINKAKQMIARSLTGLIIALGSYTLLYTINPDLVEFRALQVMRIDKGTMEVPEDYGKNITEEGTPSELPDLMSLDGIPNVTFSPGKDRRAAPAVGEALAKAMEQFKGYNSGGVTINYAIRTPTQQYGLLTKMCGCTSEEELIPELKKAKITKISGSGWQKYCKNNLVTDCAAGSSFLTLEITPEKYTFKAPLVSHFSGNALDMSVSLIGSHKACGGPTADPKEQKSAGVSNAPGAKGNDVCIPKEQQKLIKAMLDNGFCVGLKDGSNLREPWHFELTSGRTPSAFCTAVQNDANLKKLEYFQDLIKE